MILGLTRPLLGLFAIGVATACLSASGQAHPGKLHIHELRASVSTERGVQWVNVKARVCVRSVAEAERYAPSELGLSQFFVYKGRWEPVRVLIDPSPQWVVPLGETWHGRACGWVQFEDLFKYVEGGYGSACLGVGFSITVNKSRASKRVKIRCGSR